MLDEAMTGQLTAMPEANPLVPRSPEKSPVQDRFCLYISGATGTKDHTGKPIKAALEKVYGLENVLAISSIVSIDPQDRSTKYTDLAKTLFREMDANKKVTIVAMSGGPIELVDIIAAMKAKNPKTEDWAKNLEVVLVSPAGVMRGVRQTLRFLGPLRKYVGESKKFVFLPKITEFTGIASFFLDPPDPNILDPQALENAINAALPKRSQKDERIESVSFAELNSQPDENLSRYVKEEVAEAQKEGRDFVSEKKALDQKLKEAIEAAKQTKDPKLIIALLRERGKLYSKPLEKAYDSLAPETNNLLAAAKIYAQMLLGLMHFAKLASTGKVIDTVKNLRKNRAGVYFIAPDLDPVFSLKDALNFRYAQELTGVEDISTAIVGLGLSSHDSWVMNPYVLAKALERLHQKPKKSVSG